ncbi:hypothetical protein [Rhizobium sp. RCC_161_2]|jgi:hypothetical protein|uniref:hypothetical protein n=1 Tax=Rhizobium sp. RCC_161_2 TaxID=3239219 RepID=UPI003525A6A5
MLDLILLALEFWPVHSGYHQGNAGADIVSGKYFSAGGNKIPPETIWRMESNIHAGSNLSETVPEQCRDHGG